MKATLEWLGSSILSWMKIFPAYSLPSPGYQQNLPLWVWDAPRATFLSHYREGRKGGFSFFACGFLQVPPSQTSSRHLLADVGIQLTGQAIPGMVTSKKNEDPVIVWDWLDSFPRSNERLPSWSTLLLTEISNPGQSSSAWVIDLKSGHSPIYQGPYECSLVVAAEGASLKQGKETNYNSLYINCCPLLEEEEKETWSFSLPGPSYKEALRSVQRALGQVSGAWDLGLVLLGLAENLRKCLCSLGLFPSEKRSQF